ncbi:DL-endopeptidase inhibitor IseA family protein [Paenibacillus sp. CN-4]|uniref:DL-endopeptidase inhibitor IseA family protein n=1 Tax=Paenibacillus nanchangensis TaxID=3348343 RepID=UPI00397DC0B4
MKKRWKAIPFALSLALMAGGAAELTAQPAAAAANFNPTQINNLTPSTIIPLVVKAKAVYDYTSRGGKGTWEKFTYKGTEYRYLSRELGTRSQLLHFVKQSYTHNAAVYYAQMQFLEHDGRMAQVNVNLDGTLDYAKATARMVSKNAETAVYELSVPHLNAPTEIDVVVVKLKKVSGYWRVDMSPAVLF